jgi:cytochrome c-type biogenesis protein CcmH/NrfG
MESPILAAAAGAAAMLLLVVAVLTLTRRRRSRLDLEAMLAAAQRESDLLRERLEELTGRPHSRGSEGATAGPAYLEEPADFVITHVGEPGDDRAGDGVAVPDRLVLSATLGEPLLKVAALSHGVRRALSAESRNRIWFEMRREVRASRRRRRQLRKRLERDHRARVRGSDDLLVESLSVEDRA